MSMYHNSIEPEWKCDVNAPGEKLESTDVLAKRILKRSLTLKQVQYFFVFGRIFLTVDLAIYVHV